MIPTCCRNLLLFLSLLICSELSAQRKTIPVVQPDPRFTLTAQRSWNTNGEEEYIFYLQNNTAEEYQLTAKVTLDLACHGIKVIQLGRTGIIRLKGKGLLRPGQDDNRHIFGDGNSESFKACRIKDGNSFTFLKAISFDISDVMNAAQIRNSAPKQIQQDKKEEKVKTNTVINTNPQQQKAIAENKTPAVAGPTAAQNMEAKAAYLLAEEEYNNKRYESSIKFLDEAAAKLGSTNPRILYLKILSLQALAQKNPARNPELKTAIETFEKLPDLASVGEDKQLEVMKIKLRLSRNETVGNFDETMLDTYKKYRPEGFTVGASLEELKGSRPDFFSKATKTLYPTDNTMESYMVTEMSPVKVIMLTFKNGRVTMVNGGGSPSTEDKNFSKGMQIINNYLSYFPPNPQVTTAEKNYTKNDTTIETTYTWTEGNLTATLTLATTTFRFGLGTKAYNSNISFVVMTK